MKNFSKIFILLTFFGMSIGANAQDLIVKHDGTNLNGKVTEVSEKTIKYEINGVSYTIAKSKVLTIKYKDGRNEVFPKASFWKKTGMFFTDTFGKNGRIHTFFKGVGASAKSSFGKNRPVKETETEIAVEKKAKKKTNETPPVVQQTSPQTVIITTQPEAAQQPQNQQHTPQNVYVVNGQPAPVGYEPRYSKAIPEKRHKYMKNVFAVEVGAGMNTNSVAEPWTIFYYDKLAELYNKNVKAHKGTFSLGLRYTHNFTPFFGIDFGIIKANFNKYYSNINYLMGLRFTTAEFGKNTSFYGAMNAGVGYEKATNRFGVSEIELVDITGVEEYISTTKEVVNKYNNKINYIDFYYINDGIYDGIYAEGFWLYKDKKPKRGFVYSAGAEIGFNIARYCLLGFYFAFEPHIYDYAYGSDYGYGSSGIVIDPGLFSYGIKLGVNLGKTTEKIIPAKPAKLLNPITTASHGGISDKYKKNAFALDNDLGGGNGVFTYGLSIGWLHNFSKYFGWDVINVGTGVSAGKGMDTSWGGLNVMSGIRAYTPRFANEMCVYAQSRFGYSTNIDMHYFAWSVGAGLQFTNSVYGGVVVQGSHLGYGGVSGRIGFNF